MNRILFLLLTLAAATTFLHAQDIVIQGTVRDALSGQPLSFVTVYLEGSQISDETDDQGEFKITTTQFEKETLIASRVGYKPFSIALRGDKLDKTSDFKIELESATSDLEVEVTDKRLDDGSIIEDVGALEKIPTATGNIESILPHIGLGVNTGTGGELSSQYNVRGGNFDENLVYVNGFEIYRPQLIRSSQQEGLTFANPDLIGNLKFSSGGFESKYGDKMSSVLD
ncbi:MAG TPA: carboxypeptidase-like regulatory domain-containing protein, partial [Saprospiraceae bacterium]|nr:carboxypeptidase-like regulatory domain-containing protein [Saprospiraceae bacterium]